MLKTGWKIFVLSSIFIAELLWNNAIAGDGPKGPNGESRTQDLSIAQKQIGPSPPPIRQGKETSMSRENSKMESNESPDQILEEIRQIEYNEIKYHEESKDYYGYIVGKIPILISAPHGAKHFRRRENRWKGEDEYTAALAIELGKLTGAHVIYVKNKTREDPNNDVSCSYKTAVAKAVKQYHIQFLLDLHGSDEGRPYKVDIGIINNESGKESCPTFRGIIQSVFSDFQPRMFNQRFCANDASTMTFFARQKLGIEAAQIEINGKYRILERKPDSSKAKAGIEPHFKAKREDVLALITRLKQLIFEINRKAGKGAAELS